MSHNPIPNESFLLQSIATGDEDAFAKLFAGYQQKVAGFVLSIIESREITQEIVQDIFIKVWQQRTGLLEIHNFDAYLFILSKNHTLNYIRKINRDKKKETDYKTLFPDIGKEQAEIESDDYLALIEKATEQLPPQQQRVFKLRMEGLKNREIASQLSISTDSVTKYQQLAMKSVSFYVRTHLSCLGLWLLAAAMQK